MSVIPARLASIVVVLFYGIVLSCPAYCTNETVRIAAGQTVETEDPHAHHRSTGEEPGEGATASIETQSEGCCGSCGLEVAPVRAAAKADYASPQTVAIVEPFATDDRHALGNRRQPPTTISRASPPGSSLTPLRI